jgi:membrane protease YdiL (CAAX protease family)
VGDAPKLSGLPAVLLINLLSAGYFAPMAFRAVRESVKADAAYFAWHVLGIVLAALGSGAARGATTLQIRGGRNDGFLQPLPLLLPPRLGLSLLDGFLAMLVALLIPVAGLSAAGPLGLAFVSKAPLGLFVYVAFFVVGQASMAWARALGPPRSARNLSYVGLALNLLGFALMFFSVGPLLPRYPAASALARRWLEGDSAALAALYGATLLLVLAAYQALVAAERHGFDQLDVQERAPARLKGVQSRVALEWQMMWRQGGKAQVIAFSALLLGAAAVLVLRIPARVRPQALQVFGGFAVYLGALQTIALAGRAARADLMARAFLAALPLSPHQVLDGKVSALRKLLIPVFCMLGLVALTDALIAEPSLTYRALLCMASLYIVVDGAVGVAFLSSGVGVVGVAGGQTGSSFSTQLLMLPLFATLLANDAWAATVSGIALLAVTREAQRAAKQSVRWLDDPDDDVERETSVWRALLAATVFFSMQILSLRLLGLFDLPAGLTFAITFFAASAVLMLITWRNAARMARPRFWPLKAGYVPLGVIGGGVSGLLALGLVRLLAPASPAPAHALSSSESAALFLTTVVVAPLAEEYFFRGWLQKAIEQDLPDSMKHFAFAFGAAAFALAHVGSYGVPQLALGLVAGALYARGAGLLPAMLAHATHNAVVLWAAA